MTYGSKLANSSWLGLMGLALCLTGCPGGDDGDTGATTVSVPTTGTPMTSSATDEPTTTDTPMTSTSGQTGETGTPGSSGDVTTDTPPGDSSSGEPPAMCGLAVQLQFMNPACGPCVEANCCSELQLCFGDETTMMETECLQLNNCIVMSCSMATTQMELEECVNTNCMEQAGSLQDWFAHQVCLGMNCAAECS